MPVDPQDDTNTLVKSTLGPTIGRPSLSMTFRSISIEVIKKNGKTLMVASDIHPVFVGFSKNEARDYHVHRRVNFTVKQHVIILEDAIRVVLHLGREDGQYSLDFSWVLKANYPHQPCFCNSSTLNY